MEIKEAQKLVDKWITTIGKRYFSVLTNTCILSEEVGEFSSLIAREYGEQSFKKGQKPQDIKAEISDELADVLWVTICLANQLDIDLEEAFVKNIEKKTKRDVDRHF